MRGQGRVFRPIVNGRESRVGWLHYGVRGERHRESSGTTSKRAAMELLRKRTGKRKGNTLTGPSDRVTLAELKDDAPALQRSSWRTRRRATTSARFTARADFRKAWSAACTAAGLDGRLVRDPPAHCGEGFPRRRGKRRGDREIVRVEESGYV